MDGQAIPLGWEEVLEELAAEILDDPAPKRSDCRIRRILTVECSYYPFVDCEAMMNILFGDLLSAIMCDSLCDFILLVHLHNRWEKIV